MIEIIIFFQIAASKKALLYFQNRIKLLILTANNSYNPLYYFPDIVKYFPSDSR